MAKSKHCPLTDPQIPCVYEPGRCLKCRMEQLAVFALNLRRAVHGLTPFPGSMACSHYELAGTDPAKEHEAWLLWQEEQQAAMNASKFTPVDVFKLQEGLSRLGYSSAELEQNIKEYFEKYGPRPDTSTAQSEKE